ncbi:DUF3427 domain-containing protein [Bilifractor porci]|uniref:DEAD/DEAH box helicase n=1 Tax=Bilifractor porci TaxID=2606636 RepID=A0A7X2P703_9FIRM|nr:DUF3427 domain-containing protein [Bilifractor porci]MST81393.1 DEAD/DEAH box helicase [Bilifractor porci]
MDNIRRKVLNEYAKKIEDGAYSAFIDGTHNTNLAYKPEFVSNNYREGRKVLSTIESELLRCEKFYISVAFITLSGITPLLQTLKELEMKGIPGKILTTDYLNFSDPRAIHKLQELTNIEIRMYMADEAEGFHTKGYIFENKEIYRIIVGSSNLTMTALTRNKEWNTKIVSTEDGEYAEKIRQEFQELWSSENTKRYDQFMPAYQTAYEVSREQRRIAKKAFQNSLAIDLETYRLKPNSMQVGFIKNLKKMIKEGKKRALLISATGTGKTYASAFAMREENPEKMLFIVHREQIAKQAMASYKRVFGNTKTFGLLSGNSKNYDADYLFATMQMMAKDETLQHFERDEFSFITIDEVHKSGSASYQKILRYFHPKFWLGMSATPERTDGYDIYQLFDHNIAYEIRLQQAMEENLLCPFHYFGITDLILDGEISQDESFLERTDPAERIRQFNYLTSDARVDYILAKAAYYGHSGDRVKGLMFVSRREVGENLSQKLNERGLRTVFLSGETSQEKRENYIERLSTDNPDADLLDYILTVDIFNEGVDIPEVNQVILLRPTQSPIIFVQQLGRGLRKANNKEFVVILDFIGNYTNNYMIPIALSGDRSYNKDNMRRYVADGARVIPGSSSIHFDEISRKRIYAAIDSANVNDIKLMRGNYENLKFKLGRIPTLRDFDEYGEMDVLLIIGKCGSYHNFLVKYEKEYKIRLTERETRVIEFVSLKLADGKRAEELLLLKHALEAPENIFSGCAAPIQDSFRLNVINYLTNEFPTGAGKKKFSDCVLIQPNGSGNGDYNLSESFRKMLGDPEFRAILAEVLDFGLYRNKRDYSNTYRDTKLVLYRKYTYEDVCRLLNWEHNEVPLNIGGYKYDPKTKTFPVFVNYIKDESVAATQQYEDIFTAPDRLTAISKSGRTLTSDDVQNFLRCEERGIAVHLFVRKNKDDKVSKEFYYLGRMFPDKTMQPEEFILPGTDKTAVRMYWKLDVPVREDLYEYITEKEL